MLSVVYVQSVCDVASQADLSRVWRPTGLYKPSSTSIGLKVAFASRSVHSLDLGGVQVRHILHPEELNSRKIRQGYSCHLSRYVLCLASGAPALSLSAGLGSDQYLTDCLWNLDQTVKMGLEQSEKLKCTVLPSAEICHVFLEPTAAGGCRNRLDYSWYHFRQC